MQKFEQLGVIGCGLMGGSFALGLKKAGLVKRVVGFSKSPSTTQLAQDCGVIDLQAHSALYACSGSDLILVAVPVAATQTVLSTIRDFLRPGTLVMDVGSTKQSVVDAANAALGDKAQYFVPAHPIAGKESAGVEHAQANLYQGANVILTPQDNTDAHLLEKAKSVWQALGARVQSMSAKEHDAVFASVSHLPHLLAFAYINGVIGQPNAEQQLALAGSGFRDFSRIAASDTTLWRDVLLANRTQVLVQLRQYVIALQDMQQALHEKDTVTLEKLIHSASEARSHWPLTK